MMRNKDTVLCAAQPASVFRAVDACAPCCHDGMDWNHWDRNVRQRSGWDNHSGCDSCNTANVNSCNYGCNTGWDTRTGCDSCAAASASSCNHSCTNGCNTRTGCNSCNSCTAASASNCNHGCTAANASGCNSCATGCNTRTGCDSCNPCAAASASSCNSCATGCNTRTGCNSCNSCTAANATPCARSCTVCPNCNGCTACSAAARCPVCTRAACTCGLTPAMVYETPHCLNNLHGIEEAIRKGTLFNELYMPMNGECADACGANLCDGQAEAFAAWELRLYLNTHPCDEQALEMFRRFCRRGDHPNYACAFAFDDSCPDRWSWTDAPWPWEFNAACENNCCCN